MTEDDKRTRRTELRFRIDAFRPETLPMARLAEYLTQLAVILGETRSVHLVRIEEGSTVLVHEVDHAVVPSIESRVADVREGGGPAAARRAFRKMNDHLAEDDARAYLHSGDTDSQLLAFPGRAESGGDLRPPKQRGTVSGVVVRVGGVGDRIPVLLDSHGERTAGCHADRTTAKKLGRHLFEPVRLYGEGQWKRGTDGSWGIDHFSIQRFTALDKATLSEVLEKLRPVVADWGDEAFDELEAIRGCGERGE